MSKLQVDSRDHFEIIRRIVFDDSTPTSTKILTAKVQAPPIRPVRPRRHHDPGHLPTWAARLGSISDNGVARRV